MPRLVSRAVRLVKFGAVAGALVGVGRLVLKRRRRSETAESSWPTIAETAAQNGQPVDDDANAGAPDPSAEAEAGDGDGTGDDSGDGPQDS